MAPAQDSGWLEGVSASRVINKKDRTQLTLYNPETWKKLDAKVAKLRSDGDLRKLAQALLNAFRITEAHQVTQDLTSLPKATVTDWKLRGTTALRADAPSDTIIAYKKALSLDPNAALPPYKELITPAPPTFRLKGFDLPPDREGSIRSTDSKRHGTMIFRNQTAYTLEIFYLNGDGKRDGRYRRLPPGATYNQGTFFTHVWLVCDTKGRALGIFQTNKRSRTILLLEASTADPKP
jgi:hypothetical protein